VIETFAKRFLERPAVLWLSESGSKVVAQYDEVASAIGLKIEPDKNLPDLILADLGPTEPLIIFVEIVATDGAITYRRQETIYAMTDLAGFKRSQVAFLTAYQDRESAGFRKTVAGLAWNSFAWFVSEPDRIIILRDNRVSPARLSDLLAILPHHPREGGPDL
jgi:BsuBI/PstI restriction endonuclease domain